MSLLVGVGFSPLNGFLGCRKEAHLLYPNLFHHRDLDLTTKRRKCDSVGTYLGPNGLPIFSPPIPLACDPLRKNFLGRAGSNDSKSRFEAEVSRVFPFSPVRETPSFWCISTLLLQSCGSYTMLPRKLGGSPLIQLLAKHPAKRVPSEYDCDRVKSVQWKANPR